MSAASMKSSAESAAEEMPRSTSSHRPSISPSASCAPPECSCARQYATTPSCATSSICRVRRKTSICCAFGPRTVVCSDWYAFGFGVEM